MNDISIGNYFVLPQAELSVQVSCSSGPGGQHVNKTSTKITLRWNISTSRAINEKQRQQLLQKLASKINKNQEIVVHCDSSRSQHMNNQLAREKLQDLLTKAMHKPKPRKKTRPSKGSIERRLKKKKIRSQRKKDRSSSYD